jgi:2-dehydropantoate 2-reductase
VTPGRTIGGVVYSACEVTAPGVVEVESARSRVILGEPDGTVSARAEAIAAALRAGGMGGEVTPRIRDAVWSKLLGNITTGPLSILTQSAVRDFGSDPVCVAALRATYAEGQAVAAALGCAAPDHLDALLRTVATMTHKPSILQDLERGRPMEVDSIYISMLDLARLAGVATPTLDMLVALTRLRARAAGLYGG